MKSKNNRSIPKMILIAAACVLINLAGVWISSIYRLPFWLDTFGIFLAAYYTNFPITLATVLLTNLFANLIMPEFVNYLVANLVVASALIISVRWGHLKHLWTALLSGLVIGLISVALYTPVDLRLHGGLSMNLWGDALYDMLDFYGVPHMLCVLAGEAVVNVIDKQVCAFLAYSFIKVAKRIRNGKKCPQASALLSLLMVTALLIPATLVANAEDMEDVSSLSDYVQTIYDNTNGLPSNSVNMIAHTKDGSVWVGGYSGLCRGNGTEFEYIREGRIANVTAMMTDRKGRLWIGTNDQGIAIWENEKFTFINREDGLSDNSVRAILQARNGDVYVGTSHELCRISEDGENVEILKCGVTGVWSIAQNSKGVLACVDYSGSLMLIMDDELIGQWEYPGERGRYSCVQSSGEAFLVGTSADRLIRVTFRGSRITSKQELNIGDLQKINRLIWDESGNLWICAYNGVGYRTPDGELVMLRYPGFDSAIQHVIQDYEGNYWIASSISGLMKLSRSPFSDLHAYIGMEPASINAVTVYNDTLYCATDNGLQVINKWGNVTENIISNAVGDKRVRCVQVDSKNRLWVCTYGGGLLCWDGGKDIQRYTRDESGAAGDYFRCLQEMPDGTMAAGGSEGITFVKDGKVTGTLTEKNGLKITQILTMTLTRDGNLYAGSDGSGIYVIKNQKVQQILTEDRGLSSRIILRMIPYDSGYFVVTSNSLNYMENNQARVLEKFPYFNNFDIVLHEDKAWVLSSCGIFVIYPDELLKPNALPLHYRLYNYRNGLHGSITANSWPYVDQQGRLYLCTNMGVQRINMHQPTKMQERYKMAIRSFLADGEPLEMENGTYHIGSEVDSIEIKASVFNYDPEDLRIRFYLDGLEKHPAVMHQSALSPITYQNIPYGSYILRLQILNEQQQVVQELSQWVEKDERMWETHYFRIYLIVVCSWLVMFATWVILTLRQTAQRKKELEVMSRQLEEQVKEQTSQIVAQSKKLNDMQQHTIEGMATLIESRDGSTGAHVRNTGVYARMIAKEMHRRGMYPEEIDDNFVDTISRIAPLHDVGKIKISDVILNKPGRLTDEEYAIMKSHAAVGGEIIGQILSKDMDATTLQMAKDIATCHHERWDGRGYPAGLQGTDIPLCARIMAVADVFDALSSKRVYKQAMSIDDVFNEMVNNENSQFQKEIVEVFVDLRPDIEAYMNGK